MGLSVFENINYFFVDIKMTASGAFLKDGTAANKVQASHAVLSEGLHAIVQHPCYFGPDPPSCRS